MALTNIEYGSVASSKVLNDNFNYLEDKIEDYSKNIASDKASLTSLINSQVNTTFVQLTTKINESLQAVYPVGAIYIGVAETCPIASLFGTWEKVGSGLISDINNSVAIKGNGKSLGLKAESDTFGLASSSSGDIGKLLGLNASARNVNAGTTVERQTSPRTFNAVGVTTDASKSGIVGTITSTKLTVNIWRRTA